MIQKHDFDRRSAFDGVSHIPGDDGLPVVGTLVTQLRNPHAFTDRMVERYGLVYRTRSFGRRWVTLLGAEANELVLFDRDKAFSSADGWGPMLDRLFPRGLMLMDGEEHRAHRRILASAFKPEPMRRYAEALEDGIAARIGEWRGQTLPFYPAIKQLTLDLAATSFLGLPLGPEAQAINRAFTDMVAASIAPVRVPLPFTRMRKGVEGRRFLVDLFTREVPRRREGDGNDLFSQVCRAVDEEGAALSPQQIADHMNFLMMAAHDTITSSLTATMWLLSRHPDWQERLREEVTGAAPDAALPLVEQAFKETLRMMPPVPALPRRAVKPFRFMGFDIPAGAYITVQPAFVHRMPEHWPEPRRFDPARFDSEAVRARHKYAWVPFGGGPHMCLGLHFAMLQARIFLRRLLPVARVSLAAGEPSWNPWPIPKPRDGLPLRFDPI